MDQDRKVHENRLRRMAGRQGLTLRKSTRKDPLALGYGRYYIARPPQLTEAIAGLRNGIPDMTLDDAEAWLRNENREGTE
jgi:hypothetical protein